MMVNSAGRPGVFVLLSLCLGDVGFAMTGGEDDMLSQLSACVSLGPWVFCATTGHTCPCRSLGVCSCTPRCEQRYPNRGVQCRTRPTKFHLERCWRGYRGPKGIPCNGCKMVCACSLARGMQHVRPFLLPVLQPSSRALAVAVAPAGARLHATCRICPWQYLLLPGFLGRPSAIAETLS